MKKLIAVSFVVALFASWALAAPPLLSPNLTSIPRQLVVWTDGGTYGLQLKDGTTANNIRGICFSDTATSSSCAVGITCNPANGQCTLDTALLSITAGISAAGQITSSTSNVAAVGNLISTNAGLALWATGANSYSIPGTANTAGLPASSGSTLGGYTFVTDSSPPRPYYNDGSNWVPLAAPSNVPAAETAVFMNALLTASTNYGGEGTTLRTKTFLAVKGRVLTAGTNGGGTTIAVNVTDGSGTCTAALPCTTGTGTNFRVAVSGTCAFASGSSLTYATGASGCTINPTILGNVYYENNWSP